MPPSTRRHFLSVGGMAASSWLLPRRVSAGSQAWVDRRNYGPFQCASAFSLAPWDGFFEELGQLEKELRRTLAIPPASETVDVFLLANEEVHRSFLAELYPRVPYRRALFVRRGGRGQVYAYEHPELAIDLRHECTHALLHANFDAVPLWLDEGLAEYFEMPEAERSFGHPHLAALRWNLRLGMLPALESLESHRDLAEMGGLEYRFAWAWVHFMLHGPAAAHRALVEYLAAVRRQEPPGRLSTQLRKAVPQLERRLTQHFQHWSR